MRLVSRELNKCLDATPNAPMNFGLLFNKYLVYNEQTIEPIVKQNRSPLIGQYQQGKKQAGEILRQRHIQQHGYCKAMGQAGYQTVIFHARLESAFVSGLGMDHPTETGLVLDHLSGLPYIPAPSQKGVLRFSHIITTLKDDNGNWRDLAELQQQGIIHDNEWQEDDGSITLYGATDPQNARAGRLIVLDAYPLAPPVLCQEVMTPHFGDYYKGKRGPTEDQSPNPIKFLAVKAGSEFVFRFLLKGSEATPLIPRLERTVQQALEQEGLGAKTALGMGRFTILRQTEAPQVEAWCKEDEEKKTPWLRAIGMLNKLDTDWGQLEQTMGNEVVKQFLSRQNVAGIVKEKGEEIRKARPKKWADKRDEMMSQWLAPSGMAWSKMTEKAEPQKQQTTSLPKNDTLLATIEKLDAYKQFKQSAIKINKLDQACATALKKKFSTWKLKKSKAKTEQKAWNQLTKRIKNLS